MRPQSFTIAASRSAKEVNLGDASVYGFLLCDFLSFSPVFLLFAYILQKPFFSVVFYECIYVALLIWDKSLLFSSFQDCVRPVW